MLRPEQFGRLGLSWLKKFTMSVPERHAEAAFALDFGLVSFKHAPNIMGFVPALYTSGCMASLL